MGNNLQGLDDFISISDYTKKLLNVAHRHGMNRDIMYELYRVQDIISNKLNKEVSEEVKNGLSMLLDSITNTLNSYSVESTKEVMNRHTKQINIKQMSMFQPIKDVPYYSIHNLSYDEKCLKALERDTGISIRKALIKSALKLTLLLISSLAFIFLLALPIITTLFGKILIVLSSAYLLLTYALHSDGIISIKLKPCYCSGINSVWYMLIRIISEADKFNMEGIVDELVNRLENSTGIDKVHICQYIEMIYHTRYKAIRPIKLWFYFDSFGALLKACNIKQSIKNLGWGMQTGLNTGRM